MVCFRRGEEEDGSRRLSLSMKSFYKRYFTQSEIGSGAECSHRILQSYAGTAEPIKSLYNSRFLHCSATRCEAFGKRIFVARPGAAQIELRCVAMSIEQFRWSEAKLEVSEGIE